MLRKTVKEDVIRDLPGRKALGIVELSDRTVNLAFSRPLDFRDYCRGKPRGYPPESIRHGKLCTVVKLSPETFEALYDAMKEYRRRKRQPL